MSRAETSSAPSAWPIRHSGVQRRIRLTRRLVPAGLLAPALLMLVGFFVSAMLISLVSTYTERFVNGRTVDGLTLDNYIQFLTGRFYWNALGTTYRLALTVTLITAVLGYAVAYAINAIKHPVVRGVAYFLLFAPLLTSVVVRSYGWMLLFGANGFINTVLVSLHLIDSPIPILFQFWAVVIGMVHVQLPFMVFPIIGVLGQVPPALKEAAADLGAKDWQVFRRVTFPLTIPGVVVGCQVVFAITASTFASPSLLGGGRVQVLSNLVFADFGGLNWPMAAVEAWVMLVLAVIVIMGFRVLARFVSQVPA